MGRGCTSYKFCPPLQIDVRSLCNLDATFDISQVLFVRPYATVELESKPFVVSLKGFVTGRIGGF